MKPQAPRRSSTPNKLILIDYCAPITRGRRRKRSVRKIELKGTKLTYSFGMFWAKKSLACTRDALKEKGSKLAPCARWKNEKLAPILASWLPTQKQQKRNGKGGYAVPPNKSLLLRGVHLFILYVHWWTLQGTVGHRRGKDLREICTRRS